MSKYCPVLKRKVVYLDCLECEEKPCENDKNNKKVSEIHPIQKDLQRKIQN